jgi:hypothetical protein
VSLIFVIFRHICGPIKKCHMSSVRMMWHMYDDMAGERYSQHLYADWKVTWHDHTIQLACDWMLTW